MGSPGCSAGLDSRHACPFPCCCMHAALHACDSPSLLTCLLASGASYLAAGTTESAILPLSPLLIACLAAQEGVFYRGLRVQRGVVRTLFRPDMWWVGCLWGMAACPTLHSVYSMRIASHAVCNLRNPSIIASSSSACSSPENDPWQACQPVQRHLFPAPHDAALVRVCSTAGSWAHSSACSGAAAPRSCARCSATS
jgi:hypothetical protein